MTHSDSTRRGAGRVARALLALPLLASATQAQDTELLNQVGGTLADARSENAACSADGRFVVWDSLASNLVPGDTNGTFDIFLLDRRTGVITLVSEALGGGSANGASRAPSISANGRYVAFQSSASNLEPGGRWGPFLYDRVTGVVSFAGTSTHQAEKMRISPDGRHVVYETNFPLAAGDTNANTDIYRYDRLVGTVELASVMPGGTQSNTGSYYPSVSFDGRFVVFQAWVSSGAWGAAFSSNSHIWRKDMLTGALEPVSVDANGIAGNAVSDLPVVSGDGDTIAFQTAASNLVTISGSLQIAAKRMSTGQVLHVSVDAVGAPADNYSREPVIGLDGRFVAFRSTGSNMPGGGTNAYWGVWTRDLLLGVTRKVSLASAAMGGGTGTSDSFPKGISVDGGQVLFTSWATNLVPGDTNGQADVFMRDVFGDSVRTFGVSPQQTTGCTPTIGWTGTPSATAGSGFVITSNDTRRNQPGLLIYSRQNFGVQPAFGSFLYLRQPIVRTPVQNSGSAATVCGGQFSFDFNTWVQNGFDGGLTAGTTVQAQYWSRDPGDPDGAHLSDAIRFTLAP